MCVIIDIITLSLAKKYANGIASGIKSYSVDGLTLKIVTTSGQTLTMNFPSPKVKDIDITADGYIIFTLEDGTEIKSEEAIPSAKISAQPGNSIFQKEDGLYVPAGAVDISEDEGNAIETRENGLYVATRGGGGGSAEETTYDNSFSQLPEVDNVQAALDKLTGGTSGTITYKITTASTGGSDASLDIQRNNASPVRLLYGDNAYEVVDEIKVVYEGMWKIYCLADKMIYDNVTYTKGQRVAIWAYQVSQNITTTIPGLYHRGLFEQNAEEVEYDNDFSLINVNNVQTALDKITGGVDKNGFYHISAYGSSTSLYCNVNKNDGANTAITNNIPTVVGDLIVASRTETSVSGVRHYKWVFKSNTQILIYNETTYQPGQEITLIVNGNNAFPDTKIYFAEKIKGLIPDSAEDITYDNTTSELEATNVQEAIDEIIEKIDNNIINYPLDDTGNGITIDGGFSGKHTYSTEEQVVGTWIDGSPIYQKTYTYSVPPSGVEITVCTDNFTKILKMETLLSNDNYPNIPLAGCPYIVDSAGNTFAFYQSGNTIKGKRSRDGLWNDGWVVTITANYLK